MKDSTVQGRGDQGMTLIEVMVVFSLIAIVYSIALPQFSAKSGTEAATKTQRFADSIRNAFDMAVLNQKTYRIAIETASGKYYLEVADRPYYLDQERVAKDPSLEESKAKQEEFDEETKEFKSLAGDAVKDDDGKEIDGSNLSPILRNRQAGEPPKWERVESMEWNSLDFGSFLMVSEMQAEHHAEKQVSADLGPNGVAYIYFFPEGYVEKAYVRIHYKKDDFVPDESQPPYTIMTNPFLGTAEVQAGVVEFDVHNLEGDDRDG